MAVHTAPGKPTDSVGDNLLTIFTVALLIGIAAIVAVGVLETAAALIFALVTIVGFAAGVVWLLGRMIGQEGHAER